MDQNSLEIIDGFLQFFGCSGSECDKEDMMKSMIGSVGGDCLVGGIVSFDITGAILMFKQPCPQVFVLWL